MWKAKNLLLDCNIIPNLRKRRLKKYFDIMPKNLLLENKAYSKYVNLLFSKLVTFLSNNAVKNDGFNEM